MIQSNVSLQDRVAVITGAANGIGKACAKRLAEHGAAVALLDIDPSGESLALELQQAGHQVLFIAADVAQNQDCQRAVNKVVDTWGRIDILFNNAGIIRRQTVVDLDEEDWDRVLAVNLKAVYLMSKLVIPLMHQQQKGVIINTGSGWGLVGGPAAAAYCASKAGVINLTRAMAIDHGPQGVRVNAICPGDTDTNMLRNEAEQLRTDVAQFLESSAKRPLARLGTPDDIADAVLYLASDLASWVTGTTLVVDGGGLAGS